MKANPFLAFVRLFAEKNPDLRLSQAAPALCDQLGAARIEWYRDGGRLPYHTILGNAMQAATSISFEFDSENSPALIANQHGPTSMGSSADYPERAVASGDAAKGLRVAGDLPRTLGFDSSARPANSELMVARTIRELDRLEQTREFNSAGFVIRDLLGGMIGAPDPQALFDELVQKGLLTLRKLPNPKNPPFPTTAVGLNRSHPEVRRALALKDQARDFNPIRVRGEPVSETLIRDRR